MSVTFTGAAALERSVAGLPEVCVQDAPTSAQAKMSIPLKDSFNLLLSDTMVEGAKKNSIDDSCGPYRVIFHPPRFSCLRRQLPDIGYDRGYFTAARLSSSISLSIAATLASTTFFPFSRVA